MKKKCLLVNPISNGKYLTSYLKSRDVEVFALIEVDKIRNLPNLTETQKKRSFDPSQYSRVFINSDQVFSSNIVFDCVIPGSECGVDTAEILAKKMDLVGNNPKTTSLRRNKFLIQERLSEWGLSSIKTILIDARVQKKIEASQIHDFHFPLILKPVDSAGNEDVTLCYDIETLNDNIQKIDLYKTNCAWAQNTHFVIQEFIDGEEYSVDFMVHNGKPTLCIFCKYMKSFVVGNKPIVSEFTYLDPYDEAYKSLIDYSRHVIAALDISQGPVHAEFISNYGKHYLVDIGARIRGGVDPDFYKYIYSMPIFEALYKKYFEDGQGLRDSKLQQHATNITIMTSKSGIFTGIDQDKSYKISALQSLKKFTIDIEMNEKYETTENLITAVGHALFLSKDKQEIEHEIYHLYDILCQHFGNWYVDSKASSLPEKVIVSK